MVLEIYLGNCSCLPKFSSIFQSSPGVRSISAVVFLITARDSPSFCWLSFCLHLSFLRHLCWRPEHLVISPPELILCQCSLNNPGRRQWWSSRGHSLALYRAIIGGCGGRVGCHRLPRWESWVEPVAVSKCLASWALDSWHPRTLSSAVPLQHHSCFILASSESPWSFFSLLLFSGQYSNSSNTVI